MAKKMKVMIISYILELLYGLNKLIHIKYLEQCPAHEFSVLAQKKPKKQKNKTHISQDSKGISDRTLA